MTYILTINILKQMQNHDFNCGRESRIQIVEIEKFQDTASSVRCWDGCREVDALAINNAHNLITQGHLTKFSIIQVDKFYLVHHDETYQIPNFNFDSVIILADIEILIVGSLVKEILIVDLSDIAEACPFDNDNGKSLKKKKLTKKTELKTINEKITKLNMLKETIQSEKVIVKVLSLHQSNKKYNNLLFVVEDDTCSIKCIAFSPYAELLQGKIHPGTLLEISNARIQDVYTAERLLCDNKFEMVLNKISNTHVKILPSPVVEKKEPDKPIEISSGPTIASLTEQSVLPEITLIVLSVGELRTKENSKYLQFVVKDETDKMKCVAFHQHPEKLAPILHPGTKLKIINSTIRQANQKYKLPGKTRCELLIFQPTTVEILQQDAALMEKQIYTLFKNLETLPEGTLVDIIAILVDYSEIDTKTVKMTEQKCRTLILADEQLERLSLMLWDEMAENFSVSKNTVIKVTNARSKTFKGKAEIYLVRNSSIDANPTCLEAETLTAMASIGEFKLFQ